MEILKQKKTILANYDNNITTSKKPNLASDIYLKS